MYVLMSSTPGCVVAQAASESKQDLSEVLRQMAIDFVTPRYDNDNELLGDILAEIDKATTYWCDEDEEYPYTLQIQKVELI